MPDLDADARALAKMLTRGGYSYDTSKDLVKRARQIAGLRTGAARRGTVERLDAAEMTAFIAAAYEAEGVRGLMMQTLLHTGLRVSEFVAVRVEDVSLSDQSITVVSGKGGRRRRVRLPVEMARSLRVHIGERHAGPLFVSAAGGAFSPRRVQQLVKLTADEAGIVRSVHPHLLRHSYAMWLRARGVPVDVIRDQLGHASVNTTQLYYGEDPARVDAAVDAAFEKR